MNTSYESYNNEAMENNQNISASSLILNNDEVKNGVSCLHDSRRSIRNYPQRLKILNYMYMAFDACSYLENVLKTFDEVGIEYRLHK